MKNLFGEEVEEKKLLREKYIEPPFSVLETRSTRWQVRKNDWKVLGIKSEVGREEGMTMGHNGQDEVSKKLNFTSIFDPVLTEVMYKWFCPDDGTILDPFAGGSVRGVVANYLGYKYTGIELRQEQVDSNREQGLEILESYNQPTWICGDSDEELDKLQGQYFDFIFSCPPYVDLEVYSKLPEDLSNMNYDDFLVKYRSIIRKSVGLLKTGGIAVFVVGEVRDKKGYYYGFVPDTIKAFVDSGAKLYNEAILLNSLASAGMRAEGNMKSKKLVKVHQNVLIFKKQ